MPIQRNDEEHETRSSLEKRTGSVATSVSSVPMSPHWRSDTSGDRHARQLSTSSSEATSAELLSELARARKAAKAPRGQAVPLRIRLALRDCIEAIDRAREVPDDPFERANALSEVCRGLEELWEYRDCREEQFGDMVNHLHLLFSDVEPEDVSAEYVPAIRSVLVGLAARQPLTDPDIRELEGYLVAAGVNVLRGIE